MPLEANSPTLRAAIYARCSSDHQSEASIEDQVRICRALVERHGWEVVQVYSDAAMSGASTFRPGYQKLLLAAPGHAFQIVVAEGLDRLSRDLADVATLHKQLSYWGIGLVTVAEGPITDLHVGLIIHPKDAPHPQCAASLGLHRRRRWIWAGLSIIGQNLIDARSCFWDPV